MFQRDRSWGKHFTVVCQLREDLWVCFMGLEYQTIYLRYYNVNSLGETTLRHNLYSKCFMCLEASLPSSSIKNHDA